jgi:two-component system nitrogen regulation response regulator GlnG
MAPGQTVEVFDLPQDLLPTSQSAISNDSPMSPISVTVPAVRETTGITHANTAFPFVATRHTADLVEIKNTDSWMSLLEAEATAMLAHGLSDVIDVLGKSFESVVIKAALKHTHGRKNDAAIRLGIGRNTITRKIQELGIDGVKDD